MKLARLAAFVVGITIVGSQSVQAGTVAVFPAKGVNLEPGGYAAIGALVAEVYGTVSGHQALAPNNTVGALVQHKHPDAAARALGAEQYITIVAVGLRRKIRIHATLFDAAGEELYRVTMTAANLDDVEEATDRIARSLHQRQPLAKTRTLTNITRTEGRVPNRTFIEKVMGLKFGLSLAAWPGWRFDPMVSLQFDGRLEGENYFLEFGAGFLISTSAWEAPGVVSYGGVFAELGASYYLLNQSISPYVGGGLTPGLQFGIDYDFVVRLAPYAQVGVMFMRQSSSRIFVDLRACQNILPFHDDKGARVMPFELGLNFGIGW